MKKRSSFRYLEPTFFSGLLDDPVLLIKNRPTGESLLFDCGRIHHLAKRILNSIRTVFITHAHMDHFMGMDTLIRSVHVSPKTLKIYGPPGIAQKLEHKLLAYDWNLAEEYWCTLLVKEIHPKKILQYRLCGAKGFVLTPADSIERNSSIIYSNRHLKVEADLCNHKIPVLIYKITEIPPFQIDENKIRLLGLETGNWINELKNIYNGGKEEVTLRVPHNGSASKDFYSRIECLRFYRRIQLSVESNSIGYVTDIGATDENLKKVHSLMEGVKLLFCECAFLKGDIEKARRSFHLATPDVNKLIRNLLPSVFIPMHLSLSNIGKSKCLYSELISYGRTKIVELPEHLPPKPFLVEEVDRPWKL